MTRSVPGVQSPETSAHSSPLVGAHPAALPQRPGGLVTCQIDARKHTGQCASYPCASCVIFTERAEHPVQEVIVTPEVKRRAARRFPWLTRAS